LADRPGGTPATAEFNLSWADALLAGLTGAGVRHAVVSPGSRSTPLALAALRRHELSTTVIPDERSAGFFALGLARRSGLPALLIGTSGSAPANWLPAVVEANADGVPIVMISADRPPELQGVGANQTIDQQMLFGSHLRARFDLAAPEMAPTGDAFPLSVGIQATHRACWPEPGPVHINAAFREPLVPAASALESPPPATPAAPMRRPLLQPEADTVDEIAAALGGRKVVIVAGRMGSDRAFPASVARLAARLESPILADPLSGLRWGPHDRGRVCTAYDLFLRGDIGKQGLVPDVVLQFGGAPTGVGLQRYLDRPGHQHWLVAPSGPWSDPARRASQRIYADPASLADALADRLPQAGSRDWIDHWRQAESRGARLCEDPSQDPAERTIVATLEAVLPPDTALFVGNSIAIRAVDAFARGRESMLAVFGNRGASGIDGNVSTALGIAAATPGPGVALIGDLALYHDMNGLLGAREQDVTFVVINNGGGAIFDLLPQRELPDFERLWLTPTGLNISKIAALYGLRHRATGPGAELARHLREACSAPGADLIEVRVEREQSTARFRTLWAAASRV
jgi:2-succinyl-5-enolpyruvyl-6-hydroxy-3-cyclohexene-1-carboxylate synthase